VPLGIPELLVILVIILLVFGPKRLPSIGRQLGGGIREFKDSITSKSDDEEPEEHAEEAPREPAAIEPPVAAPPPVTEHSDAPVVAGDKDEQH
jgi:sec-independent protein translocase protein TatA